MRLRWSRGVALEWVECTSATPRSKTSSARSCAPITRSSSRPRWSSSSRDSRGVGPVMRQVVRQMGADGWLGIGWPTEYGGQGRSAIEQFVFFDESMRAGAPVPMLTVNSVGPTIMRYGTEEQKAFFLPKILRGEIHFCIGYSEPGAGTDLASLRTRAVRDGEEYIINGQKLWTSLAGDADYIWLATRTNPEVKKHKGISLFIVDMKHTPGIRVDPLHLLAEHDINATYFDDVRVPAGNLVGGEDNGWTMITNQLNHERVTLCSSGIVDRCLEEVRGWAQETRLADGRRVIDQEWVQVNLARVRAKLEFLRLINWKVAWTATQDRLDVADASTTKVFGTEFYLEAFRLLMEILGQRGVPRTRVPGAAARGASRRPVPRSADPDLRWRDQRGRSVTSSPSSDSACPGAGDGLLPHPRAGGGGRPRRSHPGRPAHRRALQGGRGPHTAVRPRAVGRAGDRWAASACPCPRPMAVAGSRSSTTALMLERAGAHVAPVPLLAGTVLGALPVARFGTDDQRHALLPGILEGRTIVTAALVEAGSPTLSPATTATDDATAWRLSGSKICVPAGAIADRILVPARTPTGVGVFVVDTTAAGVTVTPLITTTRRPRSRPDPRRCARRAARRRRRARLVERACDGRAVLGDGRSVQASDRHHGRLHQGPRAVRPPDRDVPGRGPACGRRLHRCRGGAAHLPPGRLAPLGGAPVGGGGRDRQVLGGRGWSAGRPCRPAPPRRCRCRS